MNDINEKLKLNIVFFFVEKEKKKGS